MQNIHEYHPSELGLYAAIYLAPTEEIFAWRQHPIINPSTWCGTATHDRGSAVRRLSLDLSPHVLTVWYVSALRL